MFMSCLLAGCGGERCRVSCTVHMLCVGCRCSSTRVPARCIMANQLKPTT
jgi:hypothetical protein